jgi:TctA family transporter
MSEPKSSTVSADDQFRALMEGLRTTIPGVTVLFGFLLALPFQSDFEQLSTLDRFTYTVAFFCTAVAAILLIAPSVHQRVRGLMTGIPRRSSEHVKAAVALTVAGTVSFLVAIVASTFLVASERLGSTAAAIVLALTALLAGWSWFYLPLVTFKKWPADQTEG